MHSSKRMPVAAASLYSAGLPAQLEADKVTDLRQWERLVVLRTASMKEEHDIKISPTLRQALALNPLPNLHLARALAKSSVSV
jgi:hypothetical protein